MFRALLTSVLLLLCSHNYAQSYQYYPAGLGSSNLRLWLDPSDISTLDLNFFNDIISIRDKTTNGYTFRRWYPDYGPFYNQASGTIQFTKAVNGNSAQILYSPISQLSSPASIFKIFRNTDTIGKGVPWSFQRYIDDDPIVDRSYIFLPRAGDVIEYFDRSATTYASSSVLGNYSIVSLVDQRPPNSANLNINGSLALALTGGNSISPRFTNADVLFLGSTFSDNSTRRDEEMFDGHMGEFFVYGQALNSAAVTLIENYLSEKWDLPISNDYYQPSSSSFKHQLVGIGQSDASNKVLQTMNSSGGLLLLDNGFIDDLNNPQFILAAHDNSTPGVAYSRPIDITIGGVEDEYFRWSRYWYLDITSGRTGSRRDIIISFNFKDYYNNDSESPDMSAPYYLIYSEDGSFNSNTTMHIKSEPAVVNQTDGTVTFRKIDVGDITDGYYTLVSSISSALNFDYRNLKAEVIDRTITISWEVDKEEEIDFYVIEESIDGINYKNKVKKYSNEIETNTFGHKYISYFHNCEPFYWRLLIQKKNGEIVYSDVNRIQVGVECNMEFQAAFKNELDLLVQVPRQSNELSTLGVKLIDIQGRVIPIYLIRNENNLLHLNTGNPLSKGIYILKIYSQNGMVYQRKILLN